MSWKDLEDIINSPTPCEDGKGGKCQYFNACRDKKLSCKDFSAYYHRGESKNNNRLPSRKRYNYLFQSS